MHPLLIAISMLALIGVTAHGIDRKCNDRNLLHHMLTTQLKLNREVQNAFQHEVYTATVLKRRSSTRDPNGEGRARSTPKTTRAKRQLLAIPTRLSLYPLLTGKPDPCREIAAELFRTLYGGAEFFNEVPGVEYQILDQLADQLRVEQGQKRACGMIGLPKEPELLAAVPMNSDAVQQIWSRMVCGSELEGHPSLIPYISLSKKKKINVVLAPKPLLHALFPNPKDVEQIAAIRDATLSEFRERLEGDEEADGREVIEAIKSAVAVSEASEEVLSQLEYKLIGEADRVTVDAEAPEAGLRRLRTFRNPIRH